MNILPSTGAGRCLGKTGLRCVSTRWARMYTPGEFIQRISPTPLLMLAADHDNVGGTDLGADRLYERACHSNPSGLVMIKGGHFDPDASSLVRGRDERRRRLVQRPPLRQHGDRQTWRQTMSIAHVMTGTASLTLGSGTRRLQYKADRAQAGCSSRTAASALRVDAAGDARTSSAATLDNWRSAPLTDVLANEREVIFSFRTFRAQVRQAAHLAQRSLTPRGR